MDVTRENLEDLVSTEYVSLFYEMVEGVKARYDMEISWNNGGKWWKYENKFRKSGKTLCGFYFNPGVFGFMIIFGAKEREKVEALRGSISPEVMKFYDEAEVLHDGKWVMFKPENSHDLQDYMLLLTTKRRPKKE